MPSPPQKSRTFPRLRLVWSAKSAPKVNWWRGLIGLQTRGGKHRGFVFHLAMKGLLLWTGSLALICFLLTTAVGAFILNKNPYNRISYADLVLPTRWDELRSKRGEALIDEGLSEIKAQRYGAGIMMLAHGLKLEPSNVSARITLGQMYTQAGYVHRALEIFRKGIPYAHANKRYLHHTFFLAEYLEDDSQVLGLVAETRVVLDEENTSEQQWLRGREAAALVRMEKYAEVLELRDTAKGFPGMELNSFWARAMVGLGRGDEAIAAVKADPSAFGVFAEPWMLLMELALAEDQPEVGRWAAQKLVALDRTDFVAATEQISYLVQIRDAEQWQEALDRFVLRFGLNDAARVLLLKKVEGIADQEVLSAIWMQFEALGQISLKSRIAYVQNLVLAGEARLAFQAYEIVVKEISSGDNESAVWAKGTRLLLDVLLTKADSSLSQLKVFCAEHPLNPDAYRLLVSGLLENGLVNEASEMAELARNRFPSIKAIPEIQFVADTATATEVMATNRQEKRDSRVTNPIARQEWDTLQEDIREQRWESAKERLLLVGKSPLVRELGDQIFYEGIMIHGQLSNQTELSWSMRRLMDRKTFDPARLRNLADTLYTAGKHDSALTLLREVLRKHPEAKWALNQRQKWLEDLKTVPLDSVP